MLAAANGQEANKGNLHARKRAERIPRSVADVESGAVPSHADQNEGVQWQQVGDEDVSAPRRHHVTVEQRSQCAPEDRAILDRLDPEKEGKDQQEDGNSLVVVASCHRARNVTRGDAHEHGGEETSRGGCDHLVGQKVRRKRSKAGEGRRKEDAYVANVNGHGQEAQKVVDGAAGHHQPGVECATSDSSKRMPCSCPPMSVNHVFAAQ